MVFQTLNRLKWTRKLNKTKVTFVHRGAENDRKTIEGSSILEIKRGYFTYLSKGREVHIPNHRVMLIECERKVVWKRKV